MENQKKLVARLGRLFDRTYAGNNWKRHQRVANEYFKQAMILRDMQYEAWSAKQ